nr:MAG TPA: minor capsid protein [Caudoviricetes sp.]
MKTSANRKIKLNDQQLTLDASQVSELYHKLTLELFDQVVDRLLERGSVSLAENPYIWQLEKMNQMGLLNDENVKLIAEYSGIAEKQLRQVIEGEGYEVYKTTRDQLAETLGADDLDDNPEIQNNLASYANQALGDVNNLINSTLPESVRSVFQSVIEESVGKVVTGITTPERALNDTIMKWFEKGFYGFTDSQGKRWKADSYARTIIRSTVKRAFREMRTAPAKEFGIDTFYFSKKATAREACAPLQHQIVTYGPQREEDGITILSMADHGYGTPAGCLGINCGHDITPFVVGFNELPDLGPDVKDITPSEAIANANAQAKQRALERSIRNSKEKLHIANKLGDKELISKYKSKIRTQQSAMRDFLKDKPFLHRDYAREKYHKGPYTDAKKEVKVGKELEKLEKHRAEQKEMREKFNSAVKSGIIKTEINNEHFENHIRGTKGYEKYLQKNLEKGAPPPSYLTITKEECQALVDRYAGTGQFKYDPKSTKIREIISQNKPIGTYIDPRTGEVIENVTDFRIHYSKTGAHIVPTIKGKGDRK